MFGYKGLMRSAAPVFSAQEARNPGSRQDSVPGSTDIREYVRGLHKICKSWAIGQGVQYPANVQILTRYY
jgi:hypothetical protein